MIKYLIYFGETLSDISVFKSALDKTKWDKILEYFRSYNRDCLYKKLVKYYKLNNIDIIDNVNNHRQMFNQFDFKLEILDNQFLKCEYTEEPLEYILPEYEYFNKQIHEIEIINYQNIPIYFDKYHENGNYYYNIYSIFDDKKTISDFISIIRKTHV